MNIAAPLFAATYACAVNIDLTAAKLPTRSRSMLLHAATLPNPSAPNFKALRQEWARMLP
ncbi:MULTISPECIES: hypothetical protein [unclassified Sphingobium]|uniref:hypothetical protein n=1 Tax=unclassified Sphingobium TaxID=2611147 RepID=UPI000D16852E|nr:MULTISPECIES: hypothetical protein [unclassified Sphingobium]